MRQYISFGPDAGICNRLKRLITGLRLYADPMSEIEMYWALSTYITEPFFELFQLDTQFQIKEIVVDKKIILEDVKDIGENNAFRFLVPDIHLPRNFTKAYTKDNPKEEYIDFEFNRIPQEARAVYLNLINRLHPSERVRTRMHELELPQEYVAVHVRLNSVWKEWNRGRGDDLKKYISAMKKYPKDTNFFLASCDAEVANYIKDSFPGRVFELPDKDYVGSIDAVADLFLLAKGKELIGSYGSTFSEFAWWLSGCTQEVTIIGNIQKWYKNGVRKPESKLINLLHRALAKMKRVFREIIR